MHSYSDSILLGLISSLLIHEMDWRTAASFESETFRPESSRSSMSKESTPKLTFSTSLTTTSLSFEIFNTYQNWQFNSVSHPLSKKGFVLPHELCLVWAKILALLSSFLFLFLYWGMKLKFLCLKLPAQKQKIRPN